MPKIRDLITPENWCQGSYGQDSRGIPSGAHSERTTKLCLVSWIWRCYNDTEEHEIRRKILEETGIGDVVTYNDDPKTTFEDVKALVDKLDI